MMDGSFLRMMLGTYSALGTLEEISCNRTKKNETRQRAQVQWLKLAVGYHAIMPQGARVQKGN